MKTLRYLLLAAPLPVLAQAPPPACTCAQTFDWVATTFEDNDAGYRSVVDVKGEDAYAEHVGTLQKRAADTDDCLPLLRDYLAWFRSGHVYIGPTDSDAADDATRDRHDDALRYPLDVAAFRQNLRDASGYEGIYRSGDYEVVVVRADTAGRERYLGVVIDEANDDWTAGQVKFDFYPDVGDVAFEGTFRMRDHREVDLQSPARVGELALDFSPVGTYRRTYPKPAPDPGAEVYLADADVTAPRFRRLSPRTGYLRLPDFDAYRRGPIDSVLGAHHVELTSTPQPHH